MEQEEAVETIMKLGLTVLQAKVYLALAKSGPATGRMAASTAQIASNDVYRVLSELQEKGLVEKIVANPAMYRVTQSEGLSILLNEKREEYFETEKQVKELSHLLSEHQKDNNSFYESSQQFVIISQFKLLVRSHDKIAAATKQSIDFCIPARIAEKAFYESFQYLQSAIKRGVKIRVITFEEEVPSRHHNQEKNRLFEQRTLHESKLSFGMHIFDRQQLTVALSKTVMPSLWTNNPNIVDLAQAYFDTMWNIAKPIQTNNKTKELSERKAGK